MSYLSSHSDTTTNLLDTLLNVYILLFNFIGAIQPLKSSLRTPLTPFDVILKLAEVDDPFE